MRFHRRETILLVTLGVICAIIIGIALSMLLNGEEQGQEKTQAATQTQGRVESPLVQAKTYAATGELKKALALLEEILQEDPGHKAAFRLREKLLRSDDAHREQARQDHLNTLLSEARERLREKAFARAQVLIDEAARLDPHAEKVQELKERIERAQQREELTVLLHQAREEFKRGDYTRALVPVDEVLKRAPASREAQNLKGKIRAAQNQVWAEALLNRAKERYARGDYKEAARLAKRALALDPTSLEAKEISEDAKRRQEAIRVPPPAKKKAQQSPPTRDQKKVKRDEKGLVRAREALSKGDLEEAEVILAKLLMEDPSYMVAKRLLENVKEKRKKVASHLEEARSQLRGKHYRGALLAAEEALSLSPSSTEAEALRRQAQEGRKRETIDTLIKEAESKERGGEYAEAIALAERALRTAPSSRKAEELLGRLLAARREKQLEKLLGESQKALANEDVEKAEELARQAQQLSPLSPRVAELAEKIDQRSRLIAPEKGKSDWPFSAEEALPGGAPLPQKESGQLTEKLLTEAEDALHNKEWTLARRKASEVLDHTPDEGRAYRVRADGWYQEDASSREGQQHAKEDYLKAVELLPDEAHSHAILGKIHADRKEWAAAIRSLSRAVALAPKNKDYYYWLGETHYRAERYEEALTSFEKSKELDPLRGRVYFAIGLTHYKGHRRQEALASFEEGLTIRKDHPPSLWEAGKILLEEGRDEEALAYLRKAVQLVPSDARYQRSLGLALYAVQDWAGAEAAFEEAFRLNPRRTEASYNLALVRLEQGNAQGALTAASKAVESDPQNPKYLYVLGQTKERLGIMEDAIEAYRKAITLDPRYLKPRVSLGGLYDEQGRYNDALATLKKAYEIDPGSFPLWNNLGNVHLHREEYNEALIFYERAIEKKPGQPDLHYNIGLCYIGLQENVRAIEVLEKVVNLDATFWDAYYQLVTLFLAERNTAAAEKTAKILFEKNPRYDKRTTIERLLE